MAPALELQFLDCLDGARSFAAWTAAQRALVASLPTARANRRYLLLTIITPASEAALARIREAIATI